MRKIWNTLLRRIEVLASGRPEAVTYFLSPVGIFWDSRQARLKRAGLDLE
jgi:hypothetical protein